MLSDSFRYTRYAGATTMLTPKSARAISAVPKAMVTCPIAYAASMGNAFLAFNSVFCSVSIIHLKKSIFGSVFIRNRQRCF